MVMIRYKESIIRKYQLLNRSLSFFELHFPSNLNQLDKAIYRFKLEELFFLQITLYCGVPTGKECFKSAMKVFKKKKININKEMKKI